jgi:hypothetical protein
MDDDTRKKAMMSFGLAAVAFLAVIFLGLRLFS